MKQLVGCCGFKCYSCAAYEGNIHSEEERNTVCGKWNTYFQYPITPEQMHCDGCACGADRENPMIHSECEFLRCAREKNLSRCQECGDYPCGPLREYFDAYREAYLELKDEIPQGDEEGYFLTYMVEYEQAQE